MQEIREIKERYGNKAESIIASGLNMTKKVNKYRCPNSMAHKHNDKDPSMSWHEQGNQFYCFACNMKIDIYSYYREHLNYSHREIIAELLGVEENKKFESERKSFQERIKEVTELNQDCKKYIISRGINEETILKHSVKSYKGDIAFPYYKYESIVGYKTRKPIKNPTKPKMRSIPGSKPYLYNFQNLDNNFEELIICEGEFDCMIIDQCGFNNVVSVGAGANSLSSLMEQAKEFLDQYQNLIIVSDNDESGSNMDETFVQMFGDKARLIDKKLYSMNDVNEEYFKKGKDGIVELIQSARFKVQGRRDLDMEGYKGLSKKVGKYISTGISKVDYALNDLAPGCVTVVVGRTNAGKTTFVRQVIANAIDKQNKVFAILGEGDQEIFINELYKCVIGREESLYANVKVNKRTYKEPKKPVIQALQEWHKGKLVLFNKGESKLKSVEELFNIISYEIKFKNHNLIVLDNLMSLLTIAHSSEKNDAQGNFIQRCCDIAKLYNTHIIVVVHPNKEYQSKSEISIENISGTMDIGNKADNVIAVVRNYPDNKTDDDEEVEQSSGSIKVLKNRYFSELPKVNTHFEEKTGLLLGIEQDGNAKAYNFNWEKYLKVAKEELHLDFVQNTLFKGAK